MAGSGKESADKLLELYYSGRLDDESKEIVQGWLSSDDSLRAKEANIAMLFEKVVGGGRRPDVYARRSLAAMQQELGFTGRTARPAPTRRLTPGLMAGAAAAVLLAGVFILPGLFNAVRRTAVVTAVAQVAITTEPDSVKDITLPDGSAVRLKGATTIAYAEGFADGRRVRIDGEAYFIVERDEARPFTVEGRDVEVTVLGTEFNMKAFEADAFAEVVLATGKLKVSSGDASVILNPSERATVDRSRHVIDLGGSGAGELSRLRGMGLSIEDVTLAEAFGLIAEYYSVTVTAPGGMPGVDGIVVRLDRGASLNEALFLLRAVNPVFDYRIEGNTVTITGRK